MNTELRHILDKTKSIYSIRDDETIFNASKIMNENKIGSLLVSNGVNFHGIVTERDFLEKVIGFGMDIHSSYVRDIMSTNLIAIDYTKTAQEALKIMTDKKIRHLPVYDDNDNFFGLASIGDLAKWASSRYFEKIDEVAKLVDYISQ